NMTWNLKTPWSEPLSLDNLSLNTPCVPESYSLPVASRILKVKQNSIVKAGLFSIVKKQKY
ncbi:MAG: hypothetical protein KAH35_00395, partial [Candidatus Atribacteria bacterium]|nr:hypothetical protein [Candidatus Atribacteria bacterium]